MRLRATRLLAVSHGGTRAPAARLVVTINAAGCLVVALPAGSVAPSVSASGCIVAQGVQ